PCPPATPPPVATPPPLRRVRPLRYNGANYRAMVTWMNGVPNEGRSPVASAHGKPPEYFGWSG
ncbi:MAG: hypothetical protein Q4C47_04660, partial [Planctomycetia bacterium]|nr:hypothetical protein [Planctomycetia bacterium]